MNTERAIREAVEEHYASLYDPNYVLGSGISPGTPGTGRTAAA